MTEYDVTNISGTQPRKKYKNNGKDGYFRFEDDNNMSYRLTPHDTTQMS